MCQRDLRSGRRKRIPIQCVAGLNVNENIGEFAGFDYYVFGIQFPIVGLACRISAAVNPLWLGRLAVKRNLSSKPAFATGWLIDYLVLPGNSFRRSGCGRERKCVSEKGCAEYDTC